MKSGRDDVLFGKYVFKAEKRPPPDLFELGWRETKLVPAP
jgi:hypothetical protein